jgi:tripartite-type tricarboxylate transporter receptor subunit TctC
MRQRLPETSVIDKHEERFLKLISRRFVLAAAGGYCLAAAAPALAQAYPNRTITIVVPAAPGSFTDESARIVGHRLGERLGQPVVIDNKPGANTVIGASYLVRQKADGYTLMFTASTVHAANPSLVAKLPYRPILDFTPIARVAQVPFIIAVNNELPVRSLRELIDHAKKNPGKVSFGSPNAGSLVAGASIATMAGVDMVQVNYKASGQVVTDLIAGAISMSPVDFVTGLPHIKAGKIRALAVTSKTASPLLEGVPPVAETFPGFDVVSWNGLVGPAGMPPAIVDLLAREVQAILADKSVKDTFASRGVELVPTASPQQFTQYMQQQISLWSNLVKQAGLKPE